MDPITIAASKFAEGVAAFLRRPRARTLRIVAEPGDHCNAVLALRLIERAPENQRRFFLYEAPFTTKKAYFEGLAAALAQELRLRVPHDSDGMRRAALVVARASEMIPGGLLVALLPPHGEGFVSAARTWTGLPFPLGVKLAVLGADVGDMEARFVVDQRELARFYASSAREVGEARASLVNALLASVGGDIAAARAQLARALEACKARGLAGEAETVLLAAASVELNDRDAARRGFVEVAQLAELRGNTSGAARAWEFVRALAQADGMNEVARIASARSVPKRE